VNSMFHAPLHGGGRDVEAIETVLRIRLRR
jgi:hypothetical protein